MNLRHALISVLFVFPFSFLTVFVYPRYFVSNLA